MTGLHLAYMLCGPVSMGDLWQLVTGLERAQGLLDEILHIQLGGVEMDMDVLINLDRLLPAHPCDPKA